MKTIKILLGIIAINLTLLTIIQTGVWPPKVQASETNTSTTLNTNYGLVPLNNDGSIDVNVVNNQGVILKGWKGKELDIGVMNFDYAPLPVKERGY